MTLRRAVLSSLSLVVLSLPAPAAAAPEAPALAYTLAFPGDSTLHVEVQVSSTTETETLFEIQGASSPAKGLYRNISKVQAEGADGTALAVRSDAPGQWSVRNDGKPFTLTYTVSCNKKTFVPEAVNNPDIFKDWAAVIGWTYLLEPQADGFQHVPVQVRIQDKAYGRMQASWDMSRPFPALIFFGHSALVLGDFRYSTGAVAGASITYALRGDRWRFTDGQLEAAIEKIWGTQGRFMGFLPSRRFLVTLLEGGADRFNGQGLFYGLRLVVDPALDVFGGDRHLLRYVAHECFHNWLGFYCHPKLSIPEGNTRWFFEGFTEYYAMLSLLRAGLITPEQALAMLDTAIRLYFENPRARNATMEDWEKHIWDDPHLDDLAYKKGNLIAFLMDMKIRRDSGGKLSLDDFMREMMKRFGPGSDGFDTESVRKTLEEVTGASWSSFFSDYVYGAKALPLELSGLRSEPHTYSSFDLGFRLNGQELERGATVTAVVPGSNAEKAGIRVGDVLVDSTHGYITKETKLTVDFSRAGSPIKATYYPALETNAIYWPPAAENLAAIESLK